MNSSLIKFWAVIGLLKVSLGASAAIIHDEVATVDLSNDPGGSIALGVLAVGQNEVFGDTGRNAAGVVDRDFLSFSIGPGRSLAAIMLNDYLAAGDSLRFIGLTPGNAASKPADANPTLARLLGGAHINRTVAGDIFPLVDSLFGEDRLDRPLGAGDYALLIQQTGPQVPTYGMGLDVAATTGIPETVLVAVFGLGLLGLGIARRRMAR